MLQTPASQRSDSVISSALWAAAGDALGWITELVDEKAVRRRTGHARVRTTVNWTRQIGGRFGLPVELPAGTYSDDTQLRLAVCRAVRGDGSFDAEAFARVELPVWLSYALGAGRASKAAALNLSRRDVNWYSNFFGKGSQYISAGGNGAAMRIQPHAWATPPSELGRLQHSVFRNAVITHGHPHGFLGACFHATALHFALAEGEVLNFESMVDAVRSFDVVADLPERDRHLSSFWLGVWEQHAGRSLAEAVRETTREALVDMKAIQPLIRSGNPYSYHEILTTLGCFSPKFRGSGLKTAIAASALAYLFPNDPEGAIVAAANALGSDTDSIGTMAGAILGAKCQSHPQMALQDSAYISREAARLAKISQGQLKDSFIYPDLAKFDPPSTQSDAVVGNEGHFVVKGLGTAIEYGPPYESGDAVWQWLELSFGQTIFAKRRVEIKEAITPDVLPGDRRVISGPTAPKPNPPVTGVRSAERTLFAPQEIPRGAPRKQAAYHDRGEGRTASAASIDALTDEAIASDFKDEIVGRLLMRCIDELGTVEGAIGFAAIVAKARLARRRRAG